MKIQDLIYSLRVANPLRIAAMLLALYVTPLQGQTDFAPGEIMFTGFNSDDPDGFSFVLLTDVLDNTVIYITDRGWANATGFRVDAGGEGTISFTFDEDYPCGTTFIFTDVGGANDWLATDMYGQVVGSVAIQAGGDADGPELGCGGFGCPDGDQLLIYQLPEPTSGGQSTFVAMIQMDNSLSGAVNEDWESELPTGLAADDIVRFNTEVDNAKYDCTPNSGTTATLQAAITNDNGMGGLKPDASNDWAESNGFINMNPGCGFCCGTVTPALPTITGPAVVQTNQIFTINITGTLGSGATWELYTAGCGVGTPLQTTMASSFTVTAPATEGLVAYYVGSSQGDCAGFCDVIEVGVCNNINNMNTCTICSADPQVCGDCLLPPPANNPDLDSGCYALRLIFILDESGSIGSNAQLVEDGVIAFLNGLNGQDAEIALIEFSSQARVVNNYITLDQNYITSITGYFNGVPYNTHTYVPGGGTNWHDAMIKADTMAPADLILFFTDGIPTVWNTTGNDCGNGTITQTPEIVNPVKLANKFKGEGTHMFMLGVGAGINETNLQAMSGYDEYVENVNTLATSDYSIGNFETLAEDLEAFIAELCRTNIIIIKEVLGPVCNGQVQFRFRVINVGVESAAAPVIVTDTFPSGYSNPTYNGPPIKLCIGAGCAPPLSPNGFQWEIGSVPPGDTVDLILTVNVLPTGNYVNIANAVPGNADAVRDTFPGNLTYDQPPVVTCPAIITVECTSGTGPAQTGTPTASDPDGTPPVLTYTDATGPGPCPNGQTITRTWTATDDCGNTATCVQTIVVDDNIPPVVTCPIQVTVECGQSVSPTATGFATATDACGPVLGITFADVTIAGGCPQEFTIQRTWTATDACDNTGTCMQIISVEDNTPPVLLCAKNGVIDCSQSTSPDSLGYTVATNNCGGTSTITYEDDYVFAGTPPFCQILRTWTVVDNCGNVATCVQTIILIDNSGPALTCPANITISCTASTLPSVTGTAVATDNCDDAPVINYTDVTTSSPTCGQEYTITRTWKATDECGATSTCVQTIGVDDNIAPSLSCPANITISCTANTLPAVTGNATSSDNCDLTPTVTYNDVTTASTVCTQEYTIARTWTTTDDCGNSATCLQMITIDDNVAPQLTCPPNITIQCMTSILPAATGSATSTDNCDLSPAVTYSDITAASGTCSQEYTITRTWSSTDDCGNVGTCVQTIVIDDSTPPVLLCPGNITIECTASTLPANTGSGTGTDNCDTSPSISYTDQLTGSGCPQEYSIQRTWKALDDCGNMSTCVQTITVDDSVAPVITCPGNITIECTASTLPTNTGSATANDACDTTPAITYVDLTTPSGNCIYEYTITRTWKATDDCGNTSTCVQTITVDDSASPVLNCPPNITIQCTANTLPANTGMALASDNCDSNPEVTYSDVTVASMICPQEYTITRTWLATDVCGNSSSCTQTIVVDDSTSPVLTCPSNVTIQCTAVTLPSNTGMALATDNCDASPEITYSDAIVASSSCVQEYTINRTWTASDTCGNTSTCVQVISIIDTIAPVITCPANITVECFENNLPPATGDATASDNCDTAPEVSYSDMTSSVPGQLGYIIHRTWSAGDACGNESTCVQVITVVNLLDPELIGDALDTICSEEYVLFEAEDPGINPMTVTWAFGSGSNPTMQTGFGPHNVQYTYNATNGSTGAWVLLTYGAPGCEDVTDTVANIHVNAVPNAAIQMSAGIICIFGAKTFQPQAPEMSGFTYLWSFGTGSIPSSATGYGPHIVEYSNAGSKTVQLIVYSNEAGASCGDTSTLTFLVNVCPGSITGRVRKSDGTPIPSVNVRLYADANLDGIRDNNTAIRSVFTTSTGVYSMASLTPGHYVIGETQPAGYFSLYDADTSEDMDSLANFNPNNDTITCTVEPLEIDSSNIFVEVSSPGIVSGYVFEDFDNNDAPAPAEGIAGVTISLYTDNDLNGIPDAGGFLESTMSAGLGFFTFGGLAIGSYVLVETQPANYVSVEDFDATNDGDLVPNSNTMNDTIPFTITNAEIDEHNYFIEFSACSGVVTSTIDGAPGSLRYLIDCVSENDTILFHPSLQGQTLHLNAGRIEIDKNLVIHSDLMPRVTIQSDVSGAFKILTGKTLEIKNLNIISGLTGFQGAAFENFGELTLWDVEIILNPLLVPVEILIYNAPSAILKTKGTFQMYQD